MISENGSRPCRDRQASSLLRELHAEPQIQRRAALGEITAHAD